MPSDISIPTIRSGDKYFIIIMGISAVPVATSRIVLGFTDPSSRMAFFRQLLSVPALKKWFRKSYRKAIWLNIFATCSFLGIPESLNGIILSCWYSGMGSKINRFRPRFMQYLLTVRRFTTESYLAEWRFDQLLM